MSLRTQHVILKIVCQIQLLSGTMFTNLRNICEIRKINVPSLAIYGRNEMAQSKTIRSIPHIYHTNETLDFFLHLHIFVHMMIFQFLNLTKLNLKFLFRFFYISQLHILSDSTTVVHGRKRRQ